MRALILYVNSSRACSSIWDYTTNFNYPFLVLPNWFKLGADVALYRSLNVSGVMMEGAGSTSTPDLHEMRV